MNDLETQLARALKDNAGRSGTFTGLETRALPLARRIRRRNRVAGVAAVAAVLAVVPLGVNAVQEVRMNRDVQPATPILAENTVKIPADPDALPVGEAPKVPWYDGVSIRDGSRRTPVKPALGSADSFGRIAGGYWIARGIEEPGTPATLELIGTDGGRIKKLPDAYSMTVSKDGSRLAWGEEESVVLTDARGRELERQKIGGTVEPVGFLGKKVLLGNANLDRPAGQIWDPTTGKVTRHGLDVVSGTATTDGKDRFPVRTSTTYDKEGCFGVYSTSEHALLWKRCTNAATLENLSADGRYAMFDGMERLSAVIADAATGRYILEAQGFDSSPSEWTSEPGGAVLFERSWKASSGAVRGIVRCDVQKATCELAGELQRTATDSYSSFLPMT